LTLTYSRFVLSFPEARIGAGTFTGNIGVDVDWKSQVIYKPCGLSIRKPQARKIFDFELLVIFDMGKMSLVNFSVLQN
jgi:hypothetical protein